MPNPSDALKWKIFPLPVIEARIVSDKPKKVGSLFFPEKKVGGGVQSWREKEVVEWVFDSPELFDGLTRENAFLSYLFTEPLEKR